MGARGPASNYPYKATVTCAWLECHENVVVIIAKWEDRIKQRFCCDECQEKHNSLAAKKRWEIRKNGRSSIVLGKSAILSECQLSEKRKHEAKSPMSERDEIYWAALRKSLGLCAEQQEAA